MEALWDYEGTCKFIKENSFSRVALQFPDELLKDAPRVVATLTERLQDSKTLLYVLADSSYNPLCVDEVAAAHATADAVIHYGRAALTALSSLPAYFVFGVADVDVAKLGTLLTRRAADVAPLPLLILPDLPLSHALDDLEGRLKDLAPNVVIAHPIARELWPAKGAGRPAQAAGDSSGCCASDARPAQATPCCQGGDESAPATACGANDPSCGARGSESVGACSADPASAGATCGGANESSTGAACGKIAACDGGASSPTAAACEGLESQCAQSAPDDASAADASTSAGEMHCGALRWRLPQGCSMANVHCVWVGPEDGGEALDQLHLTWSTAASWAVCTPTAPGDADEPTWVEGLPASVNRMLMRRRFLVEKARNASILGILVGTLGVAGYVSVIDAVKRLARAAGKTTYTMLMGKPNPYKLANFPEIEVWVMVADPQGLILDCKEYMAPIITPYEAHLALTDQMLLEEYRLDFEMLVSHDPDAAARAPAWEEEDQDQDDGDEEDDGPRFSLVDGGLHGGKAAARARGHVQGTELALAETAERALKLKGSAGALAVPQTAAEYLVAKRSWQGLEAPMVGAAPAAVVEASEGRMGRAAGYEGEGKQ